MTPEPEKAQPATPPKAPATAPQPAPASFEKPDLGPTTKEEILAYVEGKIKAPLHLPQIEGDTLDNKADRVLVVHCNYRELYFQHGDAEVTKLAKEKLKTLFQLATQGVLQAARNRTAAIQEKATQALATPEDAKLKEDAIIKLIPTGLIEIIKPQDTLKILENGRIYKIGGENHVKCEIKTQTKPDETLTGFINASSFDKAPKSKPLTTKEEAAAKKPASTATPSPTQSPAAPETPPPKLNIPDNPELAKFDFTPDVIIAFGYNHKNGNTQRARSALQVFVSKNHRASLIATGTSKEFQDNNNGLSQAEGMYKAWEEAGYPKADLDAKLASGQIVLEKIAARSLDNIKKTFENIIDQAKKNPSQPVKVCLVSDKLDHCEELVKFLKAEWGKYNNQTDHPKINLQVGCFYGSGSFILEPWLAEGTAAPTPAQTEEPAAAPAPETRRGPEKSTESNLFNEWKLKFLSGQKIYCGGSLGRDDNDPKDNFKPELAEAQIKNKGIKYIISLHHLQHVKNIVDKLNAPPENLGITLTTKIYRVGATESHFNQNKPLWEKIGQLINKGENFLIHCLNGTHRGPSALTGGFIASEKVKSLGEAIKLAGLEMKNCTQYPGLIWQLIKFAREKGLTVEEEYIKFYNENRKADQPEIPVSTPVPTTTPASPTRPPAANPKPAPANLAPTSPQPPVKPAETPDAQISEILTALNFENIAGLDLNRLDEYFQTLKKAVNADKLKIEKIIETIFPKEREKTIAIIYSNRYRQKMVTAIADNNRKNPQSGAYFQKWQKLIAAVNTTGKHRLNHLKVWQKFLEIFSTDLNKNKRSFVLKNPQATNIDPTKDLSNSHKEALDVFFKGNFIGKEGAFETGPEITAYEGGIVIAAASDFKYTGTGQETPDSTEAKAAYAGGGFSTPLSGNGLAILTYSGEVHYYSHMHSVSIKQGQIVQAGDVLGRGGNTGTNAINGKGKHLHLQMHTINYSANLITEHPPEFIRTRLLEAQ